MRFAFTFTFALASCVGDHPAPAVDAGPDLCPTAGPCEEGETPEELGGCGGGGRTWTPCITLSRSFESDPRRDCSTSDQPGFDGDAVTCESCRDLLVDNIERGILAVRAYQCPTSYPHSEQLVAEEIP